MRRAWILSLAGLTVIASAAQGQRWFRRYGGYARTPLQQRITESFSFERAEGMDDWAWRQAVEDRLTALGSQAIPLLAIEAESRKGYERDAAQVAMFRLENGVNPGQALADWVEAQRYAEARVKRIMGLRDLLPHHLMYVVEFAPQAGTNARERRVVSVAADTKVQVLSDDAALGRFLGIELAPAGVEAVRENVAEFACLIAAARQMDLYQVTASQKEASGLNAQASLSAGTFSGRAEVRFHANGRVVSVKTEFTGAPSGASQGVKLPESKAVPAMPE